MRIPTVAFHMSLAVSILGAIVTLAPVPTLAQVDLVGTWSTSDFGTPGHRSGSEHGLGEGSVFLSDVEDTWTLTVFETDGGGFHGEWCSSKMCEAMTGVIRGDTVYAVDEDGIFFGTMSDEELELCYLEPGEVVRIADCHTLAKD